MTLARQQERGARWSEGNRADGYAHRRRSFALYGFLAFIAVVAVAFLSVMAFR